VRPVTVLVFHPQTGDSGPRERLVESARLALAGSLRSGFLSAGADEVRIVTGPPDDLSFGDRLRRAAAGLGGGIVVLGSGAIPLASAADLRRFVEIAAGPAGHALANSRFSADIVAIADAAVVASIPAIAGDNGLPRWLAEAAGLRVADMANRWRLQVDIDSPLDLVLAARHPGCPAPIRERANAALAEPDLATLTATIAGVAAVMGDPRGELVIAGRTSAATLRWLERNARCRVRAIVEERGMRAAGSSNRRPPRSILGYALDNSGPGDLAARLGELGDAAIVDSRVLLAHRLGAEASGWPPAEDRFASDLLEPRSIADPWLRALTESAAGGHLPVLLGGHSLVGPGVRLLQPRSLGSGRG